MFPVLLCGTLLATSPVSPSVYTDYAEATKEAMAKNKLLLLAFGTQVPVDSLDAASLSHFVVCELTTDAVVTTEEGEVRLLSHPGFSYLEGGAGFAIIDYKNQNREREIVSVLPSRHFSSQRLQAMLTLPPGSLTQRTLIWALRVHPERPRSVYGKVCPDLRAHARNHSGVQARMNYQHHNLPTGIANSEIVAESWPWNKNVVDAALDIVDSWRQSPGHWGAACAACRFFGYDMKSNGSKWFATGVFR